MINRTDVRPKQQHEGFDMVSPSRSFTIVKNANTSPNKTIYEKYINRDSNLFDENAGQPIQLRIKALK